MSDLARLIRERLPLRPVPGVPEISLHLAGAASRLGDLAGAAGEPPYWAYAWAGGIALARYLLDRPDSVCGLTVLDVGAGSGLVGIAAAKAGAARVLACESDAVGHSAVPINAAANDVVVELLDVEAPDVSLADVDLVLGGDVFYDARASSTMTGFFELAVEAGVPVLIGDPWRANLPAAKLAPLAEYRVRDFGDRNPVTSAGIFRWGSVQS